MMLFVLLLSFAYFAFQYNQYSKYLGMVPSELDVSYFLRLAQKSWVHVVRRYLV